MHNLAPLTILLEKLLSSYHPKELYIGCAAGTLQTKLKPFIKILLRSGGYRQQKRRLQKKIIHQ